MPLGGPSVREGGEPMGMEGKEAVPAAPPETWMGSGPQSRRLGQKAVLREDRPMKKTNEMTPRGLEDSFPNLGMSDYLESFNIYHPPLMLMKMQSTTVSTLVPTGIAEIKLCE